MAIPLRYNFLSLFARPTSTVSSVGLIALIIAAFAYLQAVTDSAFATLARTGDPQTVIVLNRAADSETVSGLGKDQVNKLEMAPGLIRDQAGPVLSPEMVAISSAQIHEDREVVVNAAVRGVNLEKAGMVRHDRLTIVQGRVFQPGTFEVIIGEAAHKLYRDHGVGDEIELGTRGLRKFKIVGIFSTGGTAADSEIWGYVETLRDVYGRQGYSSVRMRVADAGDIAAAKEFIEGPAIGLTARTETEYFQTLNTNQFATQVLSLIMVVIMSIAAAFAVANTMYSAVAGRTREIGMLRALGFGRFDVLTAFVLEGLLLSLLGGILGSLISLLCHGLQRNMLPSTFTTVSYELAISPKIVGTSLGIALAIGLIGSIMPALRAARLNIITALREA